MQVITKIPLDYKTDDDSLFEFIPIKRVRRIVTEQSNNNSNYSHIFFKSFKSSSFKNESLYSSDSHKNVVIKNIGNMNQKHLKNALGYTLRNSLDKIAINESFEFKTYKEILDDWKTDFSLNENTNEAMHLVFSLKESHSKSIMELLKTSVYETMKSNFNEYQFVLIPHAHQNNPHIHCIVNKTNIWSGKKLRFAKKSDCRDFFFKLKEDFKNELYHFSGGKLDYKNDVRIKLDNIFKEFDFVNEESKKFEHRGFYAEGIKNLNAKYSKIKKSIKILESKLVKIYKQEDCGTQAELIIKKIFAHNQTLKKIEQEMNHLSDWDQNFSNFTKSFNLFEKKKALYDSIIKVKPYASKTFFKHLSVLKNQLNEEKVYIQEGIKDIDSGFDKNIFLNEKTHMFALNKQYKQLKTYRRMLKEFVSEDSSFDPNGISQKVSNKEKEVLELIETRINKLLHIHKNLRLNSVDEQKKLDEKMRDMTNLSFEDITQIINLSSTHLRNLKALSFVGKELLLAKKILKDIDNTPFKNIHQKNQNKISTQIDQIKELNQTLKQQLTQSNIRG